MVNLVTAPQTLRADTWLRKHGDPRAEPAHAIRRQVHAGFAVEDLAWTAKLRVRFAGMLGSSFPALAVD